MSAGIRVTKKNKSRLLPQLDSMNTLLADAAFRLGYVVTVYPDLRVFRVSYKGRSHLVHRLDTPINNFASAKIVDNKYVTNTLLEEAGVPVSKSVRIKRSDFREGDWSIEGMAFPLVVKPTKETIKGYGVVTNVRTKKELVRHLRRAFTKRSSMLVEEFQSGLEDFRVLVVDGKVIGALHRVRPLVIGDGKRTVRQLLNDRNEERKISKDIKLGLVEMDAELKNTLRSQRMRLSSVPKEGRAVLLKNVCNLGAGGEVHDVTDLISAENKKLAVKVADVLDLRFAGIDFLCSDISKSLKRSGGVIIEVNEQPDIAMHHYPQVGTSRDVSTEIMKAFFNKVN